MLIKNINNIICIDFFIVICFLVYIQVCFFEFTTKHHILQIFSYYGKNHPHKKYPVCFLSTAQTTHIKTKPNISSDAQTESFVTEADWHFIDNAISTKLGSLEVFSDLREPADPENSIQISISECLADTYQDLKDFSQLYQFGNPEAITQGLWECKTNFEQVWGPRIMIVIKEFHNLIHGDKDLTQEEKNVEEPDSKGENWIDDLLKDK